MEEFIKESKKIIQRSIYNNKLVLFIGAGVSANSGLPLWKDLIEKIVLKLTKEGYLNDDYFTICYINDSINLKNIGPNKIIYELEKLGIDKSIIDKNIKVFTKEKEEEKAKLLRSQRSDVVVRLKATGGKQKAIY